MPDRAAFFGPFPSYSVSIYLRSLEKCGLAELIEVGYERKPMVKGTVYELARKCGKAGCACTRGQLHRSMVLSWSEEGRTRLLSIPAERVKGLREKSERYTQYRAARAEVTRVQRRILKLLDQIEKLRREKP